MRPENVPSLRTREKAVILATVSSDPAFHGDVRAILDGRFRFEPVWDLSYEDAARLHGVKSDRKCLNVVDFADQPTGLKDVSKAVHKGEILDGCPLGRQIARIAADPAPAKAVVAKPSPIRRFVDYFSVSPARDVRGAWSAQREI